MTEAASESLKRAIAAYLAGEADTAAPPPVYLAPDRYVTVGIYAAISGRTQNSIRMKIRDGKWVENREFIRDPDGTILIDREGVQKWVLGKA
jgi:hypothetical protein